MTFKEFEKKFESDPEFRTVSISNIDSIIKEIKKENKTLTFYWPSSEAHRLCLEEMEHISKELKKDISCLVK